MILRDSQHPTGIDLGPGHAQTNRPAHATRLIDALPPRLPKVRDGIRLGPVGPGWAPTMRLSHKKAV